MKVMRPYSLRIGEAIKESILCESTELTVYERVEDGESVAMCTSYRGSRQIFSRRQHSPNKRCVLNDNVHLITRFYRILAVYMLLNISMRHQNVASEAI